MAENRQTAPPPGISPSDIYYVVFRHKWLIACVSALGVIAAALVYLFWPLPYQSEARLFIKYVVNTKSPGQLGASNSQVTTPDDRGSTILNTELEVLSSFDLALQVANSIGPSNILVKAGGGTNQYAAAAVIRNNLTLDVPKNSSVIHLVFKDRDAAICQPVLAAIVDAYYKMHLKIHRDAGEFDDFLTQQTDQLHSRLLDTEAALRAAKTNLGVISIEDTKKVYSDQIAQIQQQLFQTEAELAESQAEADEMAQLLHARPVSTQTNQVAVTNEVPVVAPETVAEYKRICGLLDVLNKREQDLAVQFTPQNQSLRSVQQQVAENQKLKTKLEAQYPGLLAVKVASSSPSSAASPVGPQPDFDTQIAKVKGLQSKIKVLTQQLDQIHQNASKLYASEGTISDLQRRYDLQQTQYNYFSMSLEQSRIDEALGPGRVSNISEIQSPSPPAQDHKKIQKLAAGVFFGGFALAFGLAFVFEFYLDQSVKRPSDVEAKLSFPLFMAIPLIHLNGKPHALKSGRKTPLLSQSNTGAEAKPESSSLPEVSSRASSVSAEIAPWDPRHILRPFAEALRDRLINFFEIKNLTHKPKLVAVTSCDEGVGVSTVAAGLAASLSETGDGNVLLVNMNEQNGSAHQFFRGDLACGLDDALEANKRDNALVQDNLYVVSEANGNGLPMALPKRFKHLVPKLKASDFDYIIFDMPPVTQISITPRLARFMDMVLMVVESEKTSRDIAKRAGSLLAESKANVGIVLNKQRSYVPKSLQQAF